MSVNIPKQWCIIVQLRFMKGTSELHNRQLDGYFDHNLVVSVLTKNDESMETFSIFDACDVAG